MTGGVATDGYSSTDRNVVSNSPDIQLAAYSSVGDCAYVEKEKKMIGGVD